MVFFPSYQYLDEVAEAFHHAYPTIKMLVQDTAMNETERENFLAEFKYDTADAEEKTSLIGFCVLGGIFSEGIDLKGTRLIGTAIVGVGLPQINHEQELIRDYYEEKKHAGFAYAYRLPGMNKVLKAAGRVIRDSRDQGVILLLDQRFHTTAYQQLFPLHWQHAQTCFRPEQISKAMDHFWQKQKDSQHRS